MSTKIVLTMIVKNEEHVIERALISCFKMIDSYCIVDTGSTDKTKEIIKTFFDSKGINGKIVDFEFTNFEECRNLSIVEGKELGDYGFWMDADEELILDDSFKKSDLDKKINLQKHDQYQITCNYSGMSYSRSQFYKFDTDFYWYGPVHEVLKCDNDVTVGEFELGSMLITPDGNSWQTDELYKKYEDHAEILLQYQKDNDWKDPRWTFYLAQSYKDAANLILEQSPKDEHGIKLSKQAMNYFNERVKAKGGFYQEVYYSQLMLARLSYHTNTDEFIYQHLLKCEELNVDNRVEHIFNLVSFLQSNQLHLNAIMYLKLAMSNIKKGNSSSLFIEKYIYEWGIYDMYAISLFYTGQLKESLKYFKYALKKAENGETRDIDLKRVRDNVRAAEIEIERRNESNR